MECDSTNSTIMRRILVRLSPIMPVQEEDAPELKIMDVVQYKTENGRRFLRYRDFFIGHVEYEDGNLPAWKGLRDGMWELGTKFGATRHDIIEMAKTEIDLRHMLASYKKLLGRHPTYMERENFLRGLRVSGKERRRVV